MKKRTILPVCLLLEKRRILLVGGGRIAARKLGQVLPLAAGVTVVATVIKDKLRSIAEGADTVALKEREFRKSDLDDADVVFCVTDDAALNKRILEEAQKRGKLVSAADGNWAEGDFIMPGTVFGEDFTVSVSTGGRACRLARQLKDNLERHIELLSGPEPFVFGVDHLSTPVPQLEATGAEAAETTHLLRPLLGVHEFFVLQTANRFEIYGLISPDTETEAVVRCILKLPVTAYFKRGSAAAEHLALVAAGRRSRPPGEKNIPEQLKTSVADAFERGFAGVGSQKLLDQALEKADYIRRRTANGASRVVKDRVQHHDRRLAED